nr:probable WRKY transcription factor protein 1 [Crassostrea gigas]
MTCENLKCYDNNNNNNRRDNNNKIDNNRRGNNNNNNHNNRRDKNKTGNNNNRRCNTTTNNNNNRRGNNNNIKTLYSNIPSQPGILLDLEQDSFIHPGTRNLIILDDLMSTAAKDFRINELFTEGSHHRNLSVMAINQNLYHNKDPTQRRNCHYLVLFNNSVDR